MTKLYAPALHGPDTEPAGEAYPWTPRYVAESELFPDLMTGAQGVTMAQWEAYDEPYKTSYAEYGRIQREKDAGAYSVKAALERSRMFETADPGWLSILKSHYGAIALGEYAAMSAEARMVRFGRAPGRLSGRHGLDRNGRGVRRHNSRRFAFTFLTGADRCNTASWVDRA